MKNNERITLRPAQAAAYLGCSPATLWRWAKIIENFPQPLKYPGQRVTVWFKDELDAWDQTQRGEVREVTNLAQTLELTALARLGITSKQPHPFILAFFLAGGQSFEHLAVETEMPERRLQALAQDHSTEDDDELTRVFTAAAAQVLHRQKELAGEASKHPNLLSDPDLRRRVMDLDKAHRLCFSQTLLSYLLNKEQVEGRDHANA